jgi:glycosyltransferase involved in cell wall biosynthesis
MKNSVLVIPAYEPSDTLCGIVSALSSDYLIIIVDDGSKSQYSAQVFSKLEHENNVTILRHLNNKGKGAALKTAFLFAYEHLNFDYLITLDADGQHLAEDVMRITSIAEDNSNCSIILGTRNFDHKTPFKSRAGNKLTSLIFKYVYNYNLKDTQTGLRALKRSILPQISKIESNKYDFETDTLIYLIKNKHRIQCVDISTVYIDDNRGSHFNPIKDSLLIYKSLLSFALTAFLSFSIDFILFAIILYLTDAIFISALLARLTSGVINFFLNYSIFLGYRSHRKSYMILYITLFICIFTASYFGIVYLSNLQVPILFSKILVDFTLFFISFFAQRKLFSTKVINPD